MAVQKIWLISILDEFMHKLKNMAEIWLVIMVFGLYLAELLD